MIDKKTIKKSLIILSLIIIIIVAVIQIGKTLARYESAATTNKDVDVAFWVIDNDFKTDRILIEDIYPRNETFSYTFTVSNFNIDSPTKTAETDLEYEIVLTTTTNLPLNYVITKNGETCVTIDHTDKDGLYTDDNGTYYREVKLGADANNKFIMRHEEDVTDEFVIEITFPKESNVNGVSTNNNANLDYADLMEDINIDLSAKQIIGE